MSAALTTSIAYGVIGVGIVVAILTIIAAVFWSSVIILCLIRGECAKCPRCRSNRIRPSWPRRALEKCLPRFISTSRCDNCKKRFFACQSTDYTA
jgi:hypothetical protein